MTITTHDEKQQDHPQHPVLRWIGHALGLAYVLVTLLFGPIRSLARRLGQEQIVQRYERRVATLPPAVGLSLSLLSLALLELSKIAVLLSYRAAGLPGAIVAMFCAKAGIGYFAHITWRAARPKVIMTYPWVARVDAWVGTQLAQLRGFRDRWLGYLCSRTWYPDAIAAIKSFWQHSARWTDTIKRRLTAMIASVMASKPKSDA